MVRQSSGLEELRDVLGAADVVLQMTEEFQEALAKAEAGGQVRAGAMSVLEEVLLQPRKTSLPEGAVVRGSRCSGTLSMGGAVPNGMRKPASSQTFSSGIGQEDSDGTGDVPPLSVISTFVPQESQVIILHLGGQWGIKVSPCCIDKSWVRNICFWGTDF